MTATPQEMAAQLLEQLAAIEQKAEGAARGALATTEAVCRRERDPWKRFALAVIIRNLTRAVFGREVIPLPVWPCPSTTTKAPGYPATQPIKRAGP